MGEIRLGTIEAQFADIIWQNEPLPSGRLVELAAQALEWKKSTTYTILKRLCDRGIFQNQKGTVTARISRQEFYAMQSEQFVEENFDGSLPAFLAAFGSRKRLSEGEIAELERMIAGMRDRRDKRPAEGRQGEESEESEESGEGGIG